MSFEQTYFSTLILELICCPEHAQRLLMVTQSVGTSTSKQREGKQSALPLTGNCHRVPVETQQHGGNGGRIVGLTFLIT